MGDWPPFHEGRGTSASRRKSRCSGRQEFPLQIFDIHQLVGATHKSLPRSVAEFFCAFLIYIDLPPSAELFERHAVLALYSPRRYSGEGTWLLNYAPESRLGRLKCGRRDFFARSNGETD